MAGERVGYAVRPARTSADRHLHQLRSGLFGCLVFCATSAASFYLFGLPLVLRDRGVSLADIGLVQLPLIITGLRLLWAPLFDRVHLHPARPLKSWLAVSLLVMAAGAVAIGARDLARQPRLLALLALVPALAFASFDTLSNSLVARTVEDRDRSIVNGASYAGFLLSTVLGGGILVVAFGRLGWTPTWLGLAGLTLLGLGPLAALTEGRVEERVSTRRWVRTFLARRRAVRWCLVLVVYNSGVNAAAVLLPQLVIDRGWTLRQVGLTIGVAGPLVSALAAGLAGLLLRRERATGVIVAFGIIQMAVCLVAAVLTSGRSIGWLVVIGILLQAANALTVVVLLTLSMLWARPVSVNTDMSLQLSCFLVGNVGGVAVVQVLAGALGYATTFGLCALSGGLGTLLVFLAGVAEGPEEAGVDPDGSGGAGEAVVGEAVAGSAGVAQLGQLYNGPY